MKRNYFINFLLTKALNFYFIYFENLVVQKGGESALIQQAFNIIQTCLNMAVIFELDTKLLVWLEIFVSKLLATELMFYIEYCSFTN